MPTDNDPGLVHAVTWLRRDDGAAAGVRPVTAADCNVFCPDDLPLHRLEVHAFPSRSSADWFVVGLDAVAGNSIGRTRGGQGMDHIVVIARLAEDRPDGSGLDEVVTAVLHGSPDKARAATMQAQQAAARRAGDLARRDRWRTLVELGGSIPGVQADVSASGLTLGGDFSGGDGRYHKVQVESLGANKLLLRARLDLDGKIRSERLDASDEARHRPWLERTGSVGTWQWSFPDGCLIARVSEGDTAAIMAALGSVPALAGAMRPVFKAIDAEHEAERLITCPTRMSLYRILAGSDAQITAATDGSEGCIEGGPQDGRPVFRQTLLRMLAEGLLEKSQEDRGVGNRERIVLSRLGQMAAAADRAGLADALGSRSRGPDPVQSPACTDPGTPKP